MCNQLVFLEVQLLDPGLPQEALIDGEDGRGLTLVIFWTIEKWSDEWIIDRPTHSTSIAGQAIHACMRDKIAPNKCRTI